MKASMWMLVMAASVSLSAAEPFEIRGTLPWHNFLSGPTAWNESDYRDYLDDLAARGLNFVGFLCYTGGAERYAPYVEPIRTTLLVSRDADAAARNFATCYPDCPARDNKWRGTFLWHVPMRNRLARKWV